MKARIVFCIREYNDIDHILPVAHKVLIESSDVSVLLVSIHPVNDYEKDYRVIYVKNLGGEYCHISKMLGFLAEREYDLYMNSQHITGFLYIDRLLVLIQSSGAIKFFSYLSIFYRKISSKIGVSLVFDEVSMICVFRNKLFKLSFFYKIKSKILKGINNISASDFYDVAFNGCSQKLMVFDHKDSEFHRRLVEHAKNLKIKTVSLPHGPYFGEDCSFLINSSSKKLSYDYVVYSNKLHESTRPKKGLFESSENVILGSTRFSSEWNEINHSICPSLSSLFVANESRFKILFLVSDNEKKSHVNELVRVIEHVASMKNIHVFIKPHTRVPKFSISCRKNITVVGNKIHSPSLISFVDLTIFTHTSVVLDAIRLNKPVVFLKRVALGKMAHETIPMGWGVECIEELEYIIESLSLRVEANTYSAVKRRECLSFFVEPKGKDVLGLYYEFVMKLLHGDRVVL